MARTPFGWARHPPEAASSGAQIPRGLRIIGTLLRTVFIIALLAVTIRVALPRMKPFGQPTRRPAISFGWLWALWFASGSGSSSSWYPKTFRPIEPGSIWDLRQCRSH